MPLRQTVVDGRRYTEAGVPEAAVGMEADLFASIARAKFLAGWRAFGAGVSLANAPDAEGSASHAAWRQGWATAREAAADAGSDRGRL